MSDDDRDNQDSAVNITQNMKSSSSSGGRRSPPSNSSGSSGPYKTKDYGSSKYRSDDRHGGYKRSNDNNYSDDRQGGYKKYNDNNYHDDRHGGYKKSNDNYRSGGNCRETIEIESNQVGSVIGRGGSNIKDVQGQFSVRINIDKNQNSNGKIDVSITGDSQSDIDDAIKHIRNQIDNSQQRYGQRDNGQRDSNYRSAGGDHRDRSQRSNYRADDGGY